MLLRLLSWCFELLYGPFAWSYDLVAWIVSLGHWQDWVRSPLPYLEGPLVLELGHGPGHLQLVLHERGILVVGLDRSRQMGRLARQRLTSQGHPALLVRADALALPFRSGVFNQAVSTFPAPYILAPATLANLQRVLLSNSELLIVPIAWLTGKRPWARLAAALLRWSGQAGHWDGIFSAALRQAGFSVEEERLDMEESHLMLLRARAAD